MLQEKLTMGIIEPCHYPHQNLLYLIKKSTLQKNRLVNIVVELKQVTVSSTNLQLFANEFFPEFVSFTLSSLIDFCLSYD